MNPITGLLLCDGFRRAAGNTGSAINAGAFVNRCSSVLHGNCSDRTGPRACFTSNAFRCINFCRHNNPPFFQPLRMASARLVNYTLNSNPSSMDLRFFSFFFRFIAGFRQTAILPGTVHPAVSERFRNPHPVWCKDHQGAGTADFSRSVCRISPDIRTRSSDRKHGIWR